MSEHQITLTVNGTRHQLTTPARVSLADVLRESLDLTATHLGCEHGVCGACTVLVNEEAMRSCLLLAVQVDGADIQTLEGVGREGRRHPLQEAMKEKHGLQCGFCTPGVIMTALELLGRRPAPTEAELDEALSGVLCRCTGYVKIREAVYAANERLSQG